jgi:hypothetical protein
MDLLDTPCWEYTGSKTEFGYGQLNVGCDEEGKVIPQSTHRVAYTYWVGSIPKGMSVRHMCHNPWCFNPKHLRLGTQQENEDDKIQHERMIAHKLAQRKADVMLYNAKSTRNHEIIEITKFDSDFNVENVYLVGPRSCECQGFERAKRCRHTAMFTMFRVKRAVDSDWFLNFDSREWLRHAEVAVGNGQMLVDRVVERTPDDLTIGEGVTGLSTPEPAPVAAKDPAATGVFRFRKFT